jgi:hypothetical protein
MAIEFTSDVDCKLVVQSFTRPGLEWDATPEDLRAANYIRHDDREAIEAMGYVHRDHDIDDRREREKLEAERDEARDNESKSVEACEGARKLIYAAEDEVTTLRTERDAARAEVERLRADVDGATTERDALKVAIRDALATIGHVIEPAACTEAYRDAAKLLAGRNTKPEKLPEDTAGRVCGDCWNYDGVRCVLPQLAQLGYEHRTMQLPGSNACGSFRGGATQALITARAEGAAKEREALLHLIHIAHDACWRHAELVEKIRARGKQ